MCEKCEAMVKVVEGESEAAFKKENEKVVLGLFDMVKGDLLTLHDRSIRMVNSEACFVAALGYFYRAEMERLVVRGFVRREVAEKYDAMVKKEVEQATSEAVADGIIPSNEKLPRERLN